MEPKSTELADKPPAQVYPPPDFSIPPPTIPKEASKVATTRDEKPKSSLRESPRRDTSSSRNRERHSPRPSSSRDYRSQSRYSTSSRYSSRDYESKRYHDERPRDNYKRKRSRSKSPSKSSSRRSPISKSSSSRKSPSYSSRDRPTRSTSHRNSPKRDTKDSRESSKAHTRSKDPQTERERLLAKWRKNYCETSEQISKKLQEMANEEEQVSWIRSSPADIHYRRVKDSTVESTQRLDALCTLFDEELLKRAEKTRALQAPYNAPQRRRKIRVCRHKCKL